MFKTFRARFFYLLRLHVEPNAGNVTFRLTASLETTLQRLTLTMPFRVPEKDRRHVSFRSVLARFAYRAPLQRFLQVSFASAF